VKLSISEQDTLAVRAAAVISSNGYILLHRSPADDFWSLLGGGVEFVENSIDAVLREIKEELGATCSVERLLWVVENFFGPSENRWHEIGFYYLVRLEDEAISPSISLSPRANEQELIFQWFRPSELEHLLVYPLFLKDRLFNLPINTEHVVNNEL
jgi:8-oxo-dGTP pyrophosphatase MutT (NUDIX family)